jgi:hypothetical protein
VTVWLRATWIAKEEQTVPTPKQECIKEYEWYISKSWLSGMSDVKNWLQARFCEHGDEHMSSTKREKYLHQLVKKACPVALTNPNSVSIRNASS